MQRELGTPQMVVAVPNSYQNTVPQPQTINYATNNQQTNRKVFSPGEKIFIEGYMRDLAGTINQINTNPQMMNNQVQGKFSNFWIVFNKISAQPMFANNVPAQGVQQYSQLPQNQALPRQSQ